MRNGYRCLFLLRIQMKFHYNVYICRSLFPSTSSYTYLLYSFVSYCSYTISHVVSSQNIWTHTTTSGWFVTCLSITASSQFPFYFLHHISLYSTVRTNVSHILKLLSYPGVQKILQTSTINLKTPGARRIAWSKFHTEDSPILCATAHNFVARVKWRPEGLQP
jgi:hypothetical protein